MNFVPKCQDVVFIQMRNLKSKQGKDFSLVKFADPTTYENMELVPADPSDFSSLAQGEVINVMVEISDDGKYKTLYRTA